MDRSEFTVPGRVLLAAAAWGDATAIEEGGVAIGYRALAARCLEATRACIAAGVSPGDRVAIWAPNVHEWIVAAVALQSAGAALVPLNTRFKGREAAWVLARAGVKLLFTVDGFLGNDYVGMLRELGGPLPRMVLLRGEREGTTSWADFLAEGASVDEADARARRDAVGPDDVSDILFTSGTTGHPKGVVTTHAQNVRTYTTWTEVIGLRAGDRYLIVNPFFHAFGYKAGWLSCLIRGATILPHPVFDAGEVLRRIEEDRVTVMPGPPTLFQSILAHPERERRDLSTLRLATTGAAVIPVQLIRDMRAVLGIDVVVSAYGLTETCGTVTMCHRDDPAELIATTSGRAIPGVEVKLVDDAGRQVPPGAPGEVLVRGYNVMRGYFDDEAATREAIDADGFLHTGDIGEVDAAGNLRITDRKKDMFIVGGFNCYPAEIENLMLAHPGIAQAAVVGVPDPRLGEVALAYVVPRPGTSLTEADVIQFCRGAMANYKVPRAVRVVDALPTNATGKVTRWVLRDKAKVTAE